ncbi:aminopeptidase-P [Coprinopsis cinerea okayama7|uniref:Aminopeptidase-P n=1 Tax=Coprinopsis cinerea (strain Okayama-7 / 130 / ATCC MYA-4618 / FGSC 9003) TaxID=240176 RepID=A8N7W4_COPC7|nr:aminopeptidase-P [Coprinopsis cinerea okayama7\|eukprot:XP_001830920.2 aminopeptidase-P [Coprinopsis cinerea okayama7\
MCFPFAKNGQNGTGGGKPKKPRRRLSWSTSSDRSYQLRGMHEPPPAPESITFHSDSEKYDELPEVFPPVVHAKGYSLTRGNTMTGTKKSTASSKWGWGRKDKALDKGKDREKGGQWDEHGDEHEHDDRRYPSDDEFDPDQPIRNPNRSLSLSRRNTHSSARRDPAAGGDGPHRSNSRATQASKFSQRSHDSQRTYASRRSHDSQQSYQSHGSGSSAPKPRPPLMPQDSTSTLVGSAYERKVNDVETIREKPDTTDRLEELRRLMDKDNLDYYIVPSEDAHGSEYVAFSDKRREYISGFTGTAGQAIITRNNAYLITDSRYWEQAEEQVDHNWTVIRAGAPNEPKDWIEWLLSRVRNSRIGLDARMISHEKATLINSKLSSLDSKLVYPPQNLVDLVWKDKPEKSKASVYIQPIEFTGKDANYKIAKVREWIKAQPPTTLPYSKREPTEKDMQVGTLITSLPQIAYLLNLRGADIPYNPLFHAYLYIGLTTAVLFLDKAKVVDEVASYLSSLSVERRDYTDLWAFLRKREYGVGRVLISPQTSYAISLMLTSSHYTVVGSMVEHMMSVKNEVEVDCMRRAYLRDGVSFVRFLAWLDQKLSQGYDITEYEAASRLTEFRRKSKNFMGLAYENISASGPNAALPHYVARKGTARMIDRETPYLNDSGGQYRDGTCDTTRTYHFGRPTSEQIEAYTRVLQGHHGTGHGFGSFLTVHEGPHSFSSSVPLVPGHVITNEPGFYAKGKWGMRIESALVVRRVKTKGEFNGDIWLGFERLTCVPIQTKMVKESMLTKEEKQWLKDHNQRCWEKLSPLLKDDKRALKWLKRESERGIGLAAAPGGVAIEWS